VNVSIGSPTHLKGIAVAVPYPKRKVSISAEDGDFRGALLLSILNPRPDKKTFSARSMMA